MANKPASNPDATSAPLRAQAIGRFVLYFALTADLEAWTPASRTEQTSPIFVAETNRFYAFSTTTATGAITLANGSAFAVPTLDDDGLSQSEIQALIDTGPTSVFNAQTGITYTPVLADFGAGAITTLSNAAAITVTLPPDANLAVAVGRRATFMWLGAGTPSFVAGAGASLDNPGAMGTQFGFVQALKRAANTWVILGSLA